MKIYLEREDVRFVTTSCPPLGDVRWVVVVVGKKQFYVHREIDPMPAYMDADMARREVDKLLMREMEQMLTKMFREAAAAAPEGPMEIR